MGEKNLNQLNVAVFAMDGFEETELTEPVRALREAGANVQIVSLKRGSIQAFRHREKSIQVPVDRTLDEVKADDYQALVLPGGALNADAARMEPKVQAFVKAFAERSKPMAAICHAPWILVSAGLAAGRRLTSYFTIQDDLKNAGARWSDEETVLDGQLLTSRFPGDLPAFNQEMIRLFAQERARAAGAA
jgi:protease I